MKKFLIILIAFLGISYSANAQTGECRVQNGNGATVLVSVEGWEADGTVYLSINSDCDDFVNVQFVLKYRGNNSKGIPTPVPGKNSWIFDSQILATTAKPNRTETITKKIVLDSVIATLTSVEDVEVTGARCE